LLKQENPTCPPLIGEEQEKIVILSLPKDPSDLETNNNSVILRRYDEESYTMFSHLTKA
jgi:hypothetical protein